MAQLPADRTKLALAQGNQVPSAVASSTKNINAITELYDTTDLLNTKVDTHAAASVLPHADGSVTTAKLANLGVTTPKIAALAVTSDKIANGAVGVAQLATGLGASVDVQAQFAKRGIDVTSAPYSAVGDGVTDDTTAINAAIAAAYTAGIKRVIFPAGTYKCSAIVGKDGVSLRGYGATLIKSVSGADTHILNLTGTVTATSTALTTNGAKTDATIAITSATGFAADDWVLVRDATYKYSTTGRNQEINRIRSISGTTITLYSRLVGDYATASTAEMVKINPITNVNVSGVTFKQADGVTGGCLYGVLTVNCYVNNCHAFNPSDDAGFLFEQSRGLILQKSSVHYAQSITTGGYGYGISLNESCYDCDISHNYFEGVRENMFTNNTRYSRFTNNTVVGAYDNGFNTHGSGNEYILIANNTIHSSRGFGIAVGFGTAPYYDKDIEVLNNTIFDTGAQSIVVTGQAGLEALRVSVKGNKCRNAGLVTAGPVINLTSVIGFSISDNNINGLSTGSTNGIFILTCSNGQIKDNKIDNIPNGYGITYSTTCDDLLIENNKITNISSNNIRSLGTNTNIIVRNNISDDTSFAFGATDVRDNNRWGTSLERNRGATASVVNTGVITHGLVGTPTKVIATGSVAGEIITVTALAGLNFTVSIIKNDGSVGTAQTIYWQAEV